MSESKPLLLTVVSVITTALILDISMLRINRCHCGWDMGSDTQSIVIFVLIMCTCAVGQLVLLKFIKATSNAGRGIMIARKLSVTTFRKVILLIQYAQTAILFYVILQMAVYSNYFTASITALTSISYVMAFVLMAMLSYKFLLWFGRNQRKEDLAILLYALSSAALAINTAIALALIFEISEYRAPIVLPQTLANASSPLDNVLNPMYSGTSILGFILMWIATAIVLRSHSQRIGRAKYWLLVTIPLIYFMSQFLTLFLNQLSYVVASYPLPLTLLFVASKPIGGILFAAAFWSMARAIPPEGVVVRQYMSLAAYGVMLFFVATQNSAGQMNYPPFGLIGASFVGLSSYLMFWGLYSSAMSVSQDIKLRQSIVKSAVNESQLLGSIGSAQSEQELEQRVLTIAKKASNMMSEETGIQTSLTEEDMKQYLAQVIQQIKRKP